MSTRAPGPRSTERAARTRRPGAAEVLLRVRAELVLSEDGYPGLPAVALRLSIPERTLKRHLREHGATFQALLDEARRRDALHLLGNPNLEIRQIAAALGYSDPPSFTRAFQRWTGERPSTVRGKLRP